MSLISLLVVALSFLSFTAAQMTPQLVNDINILNFALTLENADSTFFSSFLAQFNATGFTQAQFVAAGFNASVYTNLVQIANEEIAHAAILTTTIAALGGTPAPKCVYNFTGVTTVQQYLAIGQFFEATGTSAYDGGINALTDPNLQQATATIATVEARHSAYLNNLLGIQPFPTSAFDTAFTPQTVYSLIKPYIISCPYNITFPTVRPYGVALVSNTSGVLITNLTGPLSNSSVTNYTPADATNDLNALNYALNLEQLESYFYAQAQTNFTQAQFVAAGYNASVYQYFGIIALNEQIHVATLRAVISSRGGTPYPNCTYKFPVVTVQDYITVAALLENTGVSAYDGAVNAIADTTLQQVAATIATVEARHAAFLNMLAGTSPFPTNNDTALSPATVAAAVTAFETCNFPITLPTVARAQVPLATTVGVRGDPSFVGFLGQKFQLHGIPNRVFNILSSTRMQLNARFKFIGEGEVMTGGEMKQVRVLSTIKGKSLPNTLAWSHEGTFLSEMGLKLGQSKVQLVAGPYAQGMTVEVDGKVVKDTTISVDGVTMTVSAHQLTVSHPLVSFTVVNSDRFFNIESATLLSQDKSLDLDGLLGQTYSSAANNRVMGGSSAVREHLLLDYLVSDEDALFSDDFVRNRFTAQ